MKTILGNKVQSVEVSSRLVDSPAVLVQGSWGISPTMRRYVTVHGTMQSNKAMSEMLASTDQRVLEINPEHPVVSDLMSAYDADPDDVFAAERVELVYNLAALTGGYVLEDTGKFAKSVWQLMTGDSLGVAPSGLRSKL